MERRLEVAATGQRKEAPPRGAEGQLIGRFWGRTRP